MQHDFYPVDILDHEGNVISSKPRREIDKLVDIVHAIHILLITPLGEVVMSIIPVREDLPNVYAGKLGTTVATLKRSNETDDEGAVRAISRELFIDDMPLTHVATKFYDHMPPKPGCKFSVYYGISDVPESYSIVDIDGLIVMTPKEIDERIDTDPHSFAYSFLKIWKDYRDKLPL